MRFVIGRASTAPHDSPGDASSARLAGCDESLSTITADVAALVEELDQLRALARELADRHAEQETLLAHQRSELAELDAERSLVRLRTDELQAAERRLEESDGRVAFLTRELDALGEALAARERRTAEVEHTVETTRDEAAESHSAGHVRFVASPDGYRLATSDERCARAGDVVEIDGRSFVVTRVGRSPLPDDARPCAFLALAISPP